MAARLTEDLSEEHAEEDRRQFELVEARNQAEQLCYQLEKLMTEHAEKLTDADREPLTKAIEKTRELAKGDDTAAIKSAVSDLEQASHAFSKTLYEKAGAGEAAGAQAAPEGAQPESRSGGADDDAIDAEFEVKDS